jgi:imidazole glycerol-phosphate synthase subunit HisF
MGKIRIIPRMDIKGSNLVKGIHLEGLRVIGDPQAFARQYYEDGADEILYIDIVASLYGRNNLVEIVKRTAKYVSVPLIVAGGVRSLEDVKMLLRAGADKVSINTAAVENPNLITRAAEAFGSQCILVAIDFKRWPDASFKKDLHRTVSNTKVGGPERWGSDFQVYTDNGRQQTGLEAYDWAIKAVEMGAGELLLTSIDKEGIQKGYEVDFIKRVADKVPIPVIAGGGAGSLEDICDVIKDGKADAVTVASLLHYDKYTIKEIKDYIHTRGL